jgi:hypothetical protein
MDENNFYEVQEYLKAELESIQNGAARFCTLEELERDSDEIIDNNEKKSLLNKQLINKSLDKTHGIK